MKIIERRLLISIVISLAFLAAALPAQEQTREFSASFGQSLTLNLRTGAQVSVQGWDRPLISVSYRLGGTDGPDCRVEFEETGEGLEILTSYQGRHRSYSTSLSFEIRVPREYDIRLDSRGGGLALTDLAGHFEGKTMGGSLTLTNVRGEARLTTMGGEIHLTDSELDGTLKTMGGEVLFRDVVGNVKGSSLGGNVRYENVRRNDKEISSPRGRVVPEAGPDTVQITTMGGQINVRDAPQGADVHTMGGDIRIGQVSLFLKAKTMGGDIEVESADGWVKATTMGGDIEVSLASDGTSRRRDVELVSMSGDITLRVPAQLSMDFDLSIAYTRNSRKNYRIISDFDLEREESSQWDYKQGTPRRYVDAKGTVGGGRNLIKIRTVNGDIRIERMR